jgi:hypothetical protein
MKRYLINLLVGCVDIPINTLFFGSPYETLSERFRRWAAADRWYGKLGKAVIDFGAFELTGEMNHCDGSPEGDEAQYDMIDSTPSKGV